MAAPAGTLFGRYRVAGLLGRGASSLVYRAEDTGGGGAVAVKALREELLVPEERETTLRRFRREAAIGRELRHPRIARLCDAGERDGLPWLAFELVAGEPMDALIRRAAPLPPAHAAGLAVGLLGALGHAHARGVVHRDVKPGNVMLRAPAGEPVLMDFGVARMDGPEMTQGREILGSPAYLAPELLRGEEADHRADLFALGVVLYQALTGRRPFGGTVAEALHRICFEEPPPPSAHAPAASRFDAVLARALAKRPADRFPDAAAFAEALGPLARSCDAPPPAARPAAPAAAPAPPATAAGLRAALSAALAGGVDAAAAAEVAALAARLPGAARGDLAAALLAEAVLPLAARLEAEAPDPEAPGGSAGAGHWLPGIELLGTLRGLLRGTPAEAPAEAAAADLAQGLALRVLLYADALSRRLAASEEAPDITATSFAFLNLDALGFGLEALGAARERRLAEAASVLLLGGVLRHAAALMQRFAATRDPLARFDVLNLLLRGEDLIALAGRLAEPGRAPGAAGARLEAAGEAALGELLAGFGALVRVLDEELAGGAQGDGAADLVARLRQLELVHRFASRLDSPGFAPALAALSAEVHALSARLAAALLAAPDAPAVRAQLGAVQEMAAGLGWHDLAQELLLALRRRILADAPPTPPPHGDPA